MHGANRGAPRRGGSPCHRRGRLSSFLSFRGSSRWSAVVIAQSAVADPRGIVLATERRRPPALAAAAQRRSLDRAWDSRTATTVAAGHGIILRRPRGWGEVPPRRWDTCHRGPCHCRCRWLAALTRIRALAWEHLPLLGASATRYVYHTHYSALLFSCNRCCLNVYPVQFVHRSYIVRRECHSSHTARDYSANRIICGDCLAWDIKKSATIFKDSKLLFRTNNNFSNTPRRSTSPLQKARRHFPTDRPGLLQILFDEHAEEYTHVIKEFHQ